MILQSLQHDSEATHRTKMAFFYGFVPSNHDLVICFLLLPKKLDVHVGSTLAVAEQSLKDSCQFAG